MKRTTLAFHESCLERDKYIDIDFGLSESESLLTERKALVALADGHSFQQTRIRLVDKSISSDGGIVAQNNFELAGPSSTWKKYGLAAREDSKLRQ